MLRVETRTISAPFSSGSWRGGQCATSSWRHNRPDPAVTWRGSEDSASHASSTLTPVPAQLEAPSTVFRHGGFEGRSLPKEGGRGKPAGLHSPLGLRTDDPAAAPHAPRSVHCSKTPLAPRETTQGRPCGRPWGVARTRATWPDTPLQTPSTVETADGGANSGCLPRLGILSHGPFVLPGSVARCPLAAQ